MNLTLAEVVAAGRSGRRTVALVRELVLDADTPVSAYAKLHRGKFGFLLESLEGGERWARYTFLATEPAEVLEYRGTSLRRWRDGHWSAGEEVGSPLEHAGELLRALPPAQVAGLPGFVGGAVGFLGYDVVRHLERLPDPPDDDRDLPDAMLMVVDTMLVFDNLLHRAHVVASVFVSPDDDEASIAKRYRGATDRIESWLNRLGRPGKLTPLPGSLPGAEPEVEAPYSAADFTAGVDRIKQHIVRGDTFQTVLSRRLDLPAPDPYTAYRWLRTLNPAPYLFFLQFEELFILGSSPEALVRVQDGTVTVRPIAGTRPRGTSAEHDAALERELLSDEKERAEHMMLVDLGRNDVGRVAEYGTVSLTEFMSVERYSHVMHLVSEVQGRLRQELDALDALAACFPAGTVSGAPKVRAMEIIDSLEPTRRGPYAGAVGYLGWGAETLDTAIAIRTCVIKDGRAWVQAGAGIVADSDPEAELRETGHKADAVLTALSLAAATGER